MPHQVRLRHTAAAAAAATAYYFLITWLARHLASDDDEVLHNEREHAALLFVKCNAISHATCRVLKLSTARWRFQSMSLGFLQHYADTAARIMRRRTVTVTLAL